ncbi:hypothetical protein CEXT_321291 [Caerostris extrusa]|uniref:Uncharacterized protein n=1 Tax=Caerostris extrusa TaxID=172846 RepID=A0AAV4PZM5_CAEEX|nr:hypothetical protein CEXT_321291 [Caerostris extrusa]
MFATNSNRTHALTDELFTDSISEIRVVWFDLGSLLFKFWAPEGLNAVHTGAQFFGGSVQLSLQVAVLVLEIIESGLQFHHVTISSASTATGPTAVPMPGGISIGGPGHRVARVLWV